MRGNPQALFGKRPTEKDPAKGTSPAVHFTLREPGGETPPGYSLEAVLEPTEHPLIFVRIEEVRCLENRFLTLSFQVRGRPNACLEGPA